MAATCPSPAGQGILTPPPATRTPLPLPGAVRTPRPACAQLTLNHTVFKCAGSSRVMGKSGGCGM